jgi:hypothetical protein
MIFDHHYEGVVLRIAVDLGHHAQLRAILSAKELGNARQNPGLDGINRHRGP